jgi:hypothetical protein
MDALDYWRLCDALSVVQAALLIVDGDPSEAQSYIEKEPPGNRPKGYDAAKTALVNAILRKTLPARIESGEEAFGAPDWHQTTIAVDDLRAWLRWRGFKTGFFFPVPEADPDYLSESHPNYSAKLAAAIEAWKAVSADAELRCGKSVKQALAVCGRLQFGMVAGFKSESRPASIRNTWPECVGICRSSISHRRRRSWSGAVRCIDRDRPRRDRKHERCGNAYF